MAPCRQASRPTWAARVARLASRQAFSIDVSRPKSLERGSERRFGTILASPGGASTPQDRVQVQTRTRFQQNPDFALGWAPEAIWDSLWDALGRSWDALGALLGALGARRASLGALLGHSGEPLWCSLGTLERTWDCQKPPGPPGDRFSGDFGLIWGSIWVGLATEFGEFQERVSIRNYIHPDPSIYINI